MRLLQLLTSLALVAVIVVLVVNPPTSWWPPTWSSCEPVTSGPPVDLQGIVGSESEAFLSDPEVSACLAESDIRLAPVDRSGSWEIPRRTDLDRFAFALPSSAPAADRLRLERRIPATESPFSSPMVVATHQTVVDTLRRSGVVRDQGGVPVLDVAALVRLVTERKRWKDLPGSTVAAADKAVLLSTTDPQDSNSAAMFLTIATYVLNGNQIVTTPEQADAAVPEVCPLLTAQGYKEKTSQDLFVRYLKNGVGDIAMALVYENQFRAAETAGDVRPGQVILYPSPTVYSRYSFVPLNADAERLGLELSRNPGLAVRAEEFGFRPSRTIDDAPPDPEPPSVVDTPTYENLDRIIDGVARC